MGNSRDADRMRVRRGQYAVYLVLVVLSAAVSAGVRHKRNRSHSTAGTTPNSLTTTLMDANNLTSWITDDYLTWPPMIDGAFNGSFPKGVNAGIVFQDGIVFGGLVHDSSSPSLRVGGSTYASGMEPGSILADSTGKVIGTDNVDRVWRVRPDYRTANLIDDAAAYFQEPYLEVTSKQIDSLRSWYARDWDEWPASKGAPYVDVNGDGRYEPNVDIPGVENAAQTIWAVANDLGNSSTACLGSPSIGIEEQVTEWAWKQDGYPELDNMIYKQVELIYKGTPTTPPDSYIDSMYIAQWSDVNDGYSGDDYAGCDTVESLGYVYNGEPNDPVYSPLGLVPPAGGYEMVGGTAYYTGDRSDSAIIDLHWRRGYKYRYAVPMTHFIAFWDGSAIVDPDWGAPDGAGEMFNLFRFAMPYPGYPSDYPIQDALPSPYNQSTNYLLPGDPTTHSGWVDGYLDSPGARRILCIHGPFKFALGDTAELVVATIAADSSNYIGNVSELKWYGQWAQYAFDNFAVPSGITGVKSKAASPKTWALYQNYPNPFNPSTIISYQIPLMSFVRLKLYDVLGREVMTLVNEKQNAGSHSVSFNAANLPSGVYFYRLQAGNYTATKKLVFIK